MAQPARGRPSPPRSRWPSGLWLAYLLANRQFRGKEVLDAAVTLPLVLPPTVLGYYLLVLLGRASPIGQLYEWLFGAPLVFTWQAAVVASLFHSAAAAGEIRARRARKRRPNAMNAPRATWAHPNCGCSGA